MRSTEETQRDYADVKALLERGITSNQEISSWIKEQHGYTLSPRTVQNICSQIRGEQKGNILQKPKAEWLVEELSKLDSLESEYWGEWRRSQSPYNETEEETTTDQIAKRNRDGGKEPTIDDIRKAVEDNLSYSRTKSRHKIIERDGNLKALEGIFAIITYRARLLKLDNVLQENEPSDSSWQDEATKDGVPAGEAFASLVEEIVGKAREGKITLPDPSNESK